MFTPQILGQIVKYNGFYYQSVAERVALHKKLKYLIRITTARIVGNICATTI